MTQRPLTLSSIDQTAHSGPILAVHWKEDLARDTAVHAHAPGQLIGSLAGLVSIYTPLGWWVVPPTHAIWLPPQVPHGVRSHGPFQGWSLYVAEANCGELPSTPRTLRVGSLLRELVERAATWNGTSNTPAEHRLAQVIIDEIAGLREDPLGLPHPTDERLRLMTDAMLDDLADNRSIQDWAEWVGMTPRTLARHFREQTGFGLVAWRQRARVLRAIELLAEGQAVTTIAMDLGYNNVGAFIAMFRRVMGMTPGQYGRLDISTEP